MPDELIKDYTLTPETNKSVNDKLQESEGVPTYMETISLSDEQEKRLCKEVFDELDEIKKERAPHEKKWRALDRQYEGTLVEDSRMPLHLNRNITRPICDRVTRMLLQAFLESDPLFSFSPRPEFSRRAGQDVCDKQQDFIDYKIDNIPFREPLSMVKHSAVVKGTGFLSIFHEIKREKRRREERYKGENIPVGIDPKTQQIINDNPGLKEFLNNWPNALQDYPNLCKRLLDGKEINIIAEYKETVYNDPLPKFINLKNFFARVSVDGYEGLKTTRLIAELENYNYWDLKKLERQHKFIDVDRLTYEDKEGKKRKTSYENEDYDIYKCTFYFKLKETDEEETKILCWLSEDKKICLGAVYYPYYAVDCSYLPFYISKKEPGLYGDGLAEIVTDDNQAQSIFLSLLASGLYRRNMVTPIVPPDSDVEQQFLEKRWTDGIPISGKAGEIDFLQKYMGPLDVGGIINFLQLQKQESEERAGSSSLMSGNLTPFDPKAPASKTMALMKAAGVDIEYYIKTMIPSYNEMAYILLNIYYQISTEGRAYAINPERVVGDNPFGILSRADMMARTNIQAQAYKFDFDKLNEKAEIVGLYQLLRPEPTFAQDPELVSYMIKRMIKAWGRNWRDIADKFPSPQDIRKKMAMIAMQVLDNYVKAKAQEGQITGVKPELVYQEFAPMMQQAMSELATPTPKEVQEARAKEQGAG